MAWGLCRRVFQVSAVLSHGLVFRVRLAANAPGIGVVGDKGHQRDLPGPLDRGPKGALMFGADTGAAPGLNLGPVRNEPPNLIDVFVVDVGYFLDAEGTDLTPAYESTSWASAGAAGSSAWPATAAASTTTVSG